MSIEEEQSTDRCQLSDAQDSEILLANASELAGLLAASELLDRIGRRTSIAGFFALFGCALWLLMGSSGRHRGLWLSVCRAAALGFNQSLWVFAAEL